MTKQINGYTIETVGGFIKAHSVQKYIKCRFCSWQTPSWVTTKKGKRVSGYPTLVKHVYIEHPEEYEKIREFIDREEFWECHIIENKT